CAMRFVLCLFALLLSAALADAQTCAPRARLSYGLGAGYGVQQQLAVAQFATGSCSQAPPLAIPQAPCPVQALGAYGVQQQFGMAGYAAQQFNQFAGYGAGFGQRFGLGYGAGFNQFAL